MANEKGRNKKKREQKRIERLMRFIGIDLCACAGGHQLHCCGVCREAHTNPKTNEVRCLEMYQIDQSSVKSSNSRRPRRTWKYGRQKENEDNKRDKQQRREKRERDRLE